MPLDPQFRTVLDTFESKGLIPLVRGDAAETRAHYRTLALSRRGPEYVPEQVASAQDQHSPGGVPVRVYEPLEPGAGTGTASGSTLMYLHGGGWVVGDVDTHDPLARRVTNATGARVVSVDYRLAPEHPFPAALDDAEEVLHWLWTQDPGRPLAVAGDSAGGGLAAGVALRARDKQVPLAAQLMFYPAIDPAMTSPSIAENGTGYFLTEHDMAWFYQQYLPGGPPSGSPSAPTASSPEADLAHADVAGVAPAIVATAEFDPLRDEGAAYAARLADAGVPTQYVPGPGLIHGFAGFLGVVDAADATVADVLARLRQLLRGSESG
ncbi:MAG TPA: alpha/beta hydrolase [Streptosporangiaceae bacterium]|nr:alpha/beta hydrolase [Streptosporangiaceae bacterium]